MSRRLIREAAGPVRTFLARHERSARLVASASRRIPGVQEALLWVARGDPDAQYRRWVVAYDTLDEGDLEAIRGARARLRDPPLLSLVVPVPPSDTGLLEPLAAGLRGQAYERWELWLVGAVSADATASGQLRELLDDPRRRQQASGQRTSAEAVNSALEAAAGEFAVFVDPALALRPHSLFLLAHTIERHPDAVLVYADDDVKAADGTRSDHCFKPDLNVALLRAQNYFGGLVAFRRSLALAKGGCREEDEEDLMWGLFLRLTAGADPGAVQHIPHVLSHRREADAGPAPDAERRGSAARVHARRLSHLGEEVGVEPVRRRSFRIRYAVPKSPPRVSVVIPTAGAPELLRPCLDGLLSGTRYPELEALVVVTGPRDADRSNYLEALERSARAQVLAYEQAPFNFSRTNNWAAARATGELLCFLNDDTEVLGDDWLETLVAHVAREGVAAAGPMLLYPNGRIQHAGVVLGAGGVAAHDYERWPGTTSGYHERALVAQDVSCITAACMLVRRQVFVELKGFDEALAVAFNDVDFCVRVTAAGWRIVWTPEARLLHRESASIGRHDAGPRAAEWRAAFDLMQDRWGERLWRDPHYNPNLSLDPRELWQPAFPPRVDYPWRVEPHAAPAADVYQRKPAA
jgi:O-antigen biosynthesis protein